MVPGVDPVVALTYRATVDAQAAEGDARGLAVVRPAARAAIAPPPAGAVQSLPEEALFPIEALEKLPPEATAHYRKDGHRFLVLQLKRRENGDCVYLSESSCTIYERRPSACRAFDCREIFLGQTRNQRREWIKSGMMSREVYAAGRQRTTKTP